jgi:hypothetical protein
MSMRMNRSNELARRARLAGQRRDARLAEITKSKIEARANANKLGQDRLSYDKNAHADKMTQRNLQRLHETSMQDDQQGFLGGEKAKDRSFESSDRLLKRMHEANLQGKRIESTEGMQDDRLYHEETQRGLDRSHSTSERLGSETFRSGEGRKQWLRQLQTPNYQAPKVDPITGETLEYKNVNPLAQIPEELSAGVMDESDYEYFENDPISMNTRRDESKPLITDPRKKKKKEYKNPPTNFEVYSGLHRLKDYGNFILDSNKAIYDKGIKPGLKWLTSPN